MVAFSDPRGRTINVFIIYVPHRTSAATAGASSTSTGASAPAAARTSWTAGTSPSSATSTFDAQGACGQDRPTAFEGRGTANRDSSYEKKPGDRGKHPGLIPSRNAAQCAGLVVKARALRFRGSEWRVCAIIRPLSRFGQTAWFRRILSRCTRRAAFRPC